MITYIGTTNLVVRKEKIELIFENRQVFVIKIQSIIIINLVTLRQSELEGNIDFIGEVVGDLEKRAVTMPERADYPLFFIFSDLYCLFYITTNI